MFLYCKSFGETRALKLIIVLSHLLNLHLMLVNYIFSTSEHHRNLDYCDDVIRNGTLGDNNEYHILFTKFYHLIVFFIQIRYDRRSDVCGIVYYRAVLGYV